jgi:hypothetical protein
MSFSVTVSQLKKSQDDLLNMGCPTLFIDNLMRCVRNSSALAELFVQWGEIKDEEEKKQSLIDLYLEFTFFEGSAEYAPYNQETHKILVKAWNKQVDNGSIDMSKLDMPPQVVEAVLNGEIYTNDLVFKMFCIVAHSMS